MAAPAAPAGLLDSLRRAGGTLLQIATLRLELLGTELEAEKLRVVDALWLGAIGLLLVGLGLVTALGFVVLLFWEGYRLAALGVLTVALLGGGAWLLTRARAQLDAGDGGPFALTLAELRRDRVALQPSGGPAAAEAARPGPPPAP